MQLAVCFRKPQPELLPGLSSKFLYGLLKLVLPVRILRKAFGVPQA